MEKIRSVAAASLLSIERALTPNERRRILDAADLLLKTGGRSKDWKQPCLICIHIPISAGLSVQEHGHSQAHQS